jgi:hypothetical protein
MTTTARKPLSQLNPDEWNFGDLVEGTYYDKPFKGALRRSADFVPGYLVEIPEGLSVWPNEPPRTTIYVLPNKLYLAS